MIFLSIKKTHWQLGYKFFYKNLNKHKASEAKKLRTSLNFEINFARNTFTSKKNIFNCRCLKYVGVYIPLTFNFTFVSKK